MRIYKRINLIEGYDLILFRRYREFEVKICDNFTGETLIIDNDFINKKSLKLKDYIPLCDKIIEKLNQGKRLYELSLQ